MFQLITHPIKIYGTNPNSPEERNEATEIKINSLGADLPFQEYKVGLKLNNGHVVSDILSRSSIHVVYTVHGSRELACEYIAINHDIQNTLNILTRLRLSAKEKFKGTAINEINQLAIPIFNLIFENNIDEAKNNIRDLEEYIKNREPVTNIISSSEKYIVWIDSKNQPNFICWISTSNLGSVIAEYTRLRALGLAYIPINLREQFSAQLGAALATAFETSKNSPAIFKIPESLILKTIENSLRTKYTFWTTIATLSAISSIAISFQFNPSQTIGAALLAMAGGFIGAFISIQERSKLIKCQITDPINTIVFQAIIRVVLGGIFGFISFIAIESGIAITALKGNIISTILIGIAAGFSERLIPEVLQSIGKKDQPPENTTHASQA